MPFHGKETNEKKYYLSSLENCERRIRTPVLQLMRLASYHCSTSLCVPHTRHVVSDLRLCGLRTFTANRIMFHCCTYFFRFCIRKPQTPARCVHHVFANFISSLAFAVLLRLPFISASSVLACTHRRIIMFANHAERPTTKYGIMLRNSRDDSAKASACLNQRQSYDTLPPLT